jgi:hypothetical protein
MRQLQGLLILLVVTIILFFAVGYWKSFDTATNIFPGIIAFELLVLGGNYWFKVRK